MSYIICENCRGYYELEEGESAHDFDVCQCGGTLKHVVFGVPKIKSFSSELSYVDSIKENYAEEKTNEDTEDKNIIGDIENKQEEEITLYCSNCGNYDSDGIFCSKCGGKLVTLKNGKIISTISNKNSKHAQGMSKRSRNLNSDYVVSSEPVDLFKKINSLGVILGIGFYIISVLISIFIMALLILGNGFDLYNPFSVIWLLLLVIIVIIALMTISGAIAAYMTKSKEYSDGILNGLVVGLILGIVIGILSLDVVNLIGNTVLNSIFGALGGVIGIWFRKNFK